MKKGEKVPPSVWIQKPGVGIGGCRGQRSGWREAVSGSDVSGEGSHRLPSPAATSCPEGHRSRVQPHQAATLQRPAEDDVAPTMARRILRFPVYPEQLGKEEGSGGKTG
ncbi:unnamed protein product [Rangifer tarandus platyrhynchus]|uniref:Uncharacterized protein n=1 Tax=Rangifer tarandus platyrhynchus TaxID=3082113 RepID=A0AC59ZQH9_RANTA